MKPLAPLIKQDRWLVWRRNNEGAKVPYQSLRPNRCASVSDPKTWSSYEEAVDAAPARRGGIGWVMGPGFAALDCDNCRDPQTGKLLAWAASLVRRSYAEVTPSGEGVRVIGFANGNRVHTSRRMPVGGKLEVYRGACGRYITISNDRLNDVGLRDIDGIVDQYEEENDCSGTVTLTDFNIDGIDVAALFKKHGLDPWLLETLVPPRAGRRGQRSDVIWKIGTSLRDRGESANEIGAGIYASRSWKSKHGVNSLRALAGEVTRILAK
jgi:hypothetical protein